MQYRSYCTGLIRTLFFKKLKMNMVMQKAHSTHINEIRGNILHLPQLTRVVVKLSSEKLDPFEGGKTQEMKM